MTIAMEREDSGRKESTLSDAALLERVQRQTFLYFWDGAHPVSGLARDNVGVLSDPENDIVAIGGSGFGAMAIIVASSRTWISRESAVARLTLMLDLLERATCFHGHFPHFMNGSTGAVIPFSRKDDGGDIVEWNWHTRDGRSVLNWHWSPNNGFSLAHEIRGWNECLLTYVLAAASPRYAIDASVYHDGWAQGRSFLNGKSYYDVELPLGPSYGGPLFFSHYSFCGLDPRGLKDIYADYWRQNTHHVQINFEHCVHNPGKHKGYGPSCWGLTASDDPEGYNVHTPDEFTCACGYGCGNVAGRCCRRHAPDEDNGVISPTAALSSFPYAPDAAHRAMRYFYDTLGDQLWGRFGFADAFSADINWFSKSYSAINQGPIVAMIENYRTGQLWSLFMKDPDVQAGLRRLGFRSPDLT